MHRDQDIIVFTPEEQKQFDVPALTSATDAVAIAEAFYDVADKISVLSALRRAEAANNPQLVSEAYKQQRRAADLARFSVAVFNLCPDEHLQSIIDQGSK